MIEIIVTICITIGTAFMFIAGLGLLRMPDLYTRMSASTKASTLGSAFLLLGFALHFPELGLILRAFATCIFLFITTPVAAHMIGRAGYLNNVPLWDKSVCDDLQGYYDDKVKRPQIAPPTTGQFTKPVK